VLGISESLRSARGSRLAAFAFWLLGLRGKEKDVSRPSRQIGCFFKETSHGETGPPFSARNSSETMESMMRRRRSVSGMDERALRPRFFPPRYSLQPGPIQVTQGVYASCGHALNLALRAKEESGPAEKNAA